ncbi:MAG: calcium-binding protein [Neisseria sp.]|uniref:calcium-binding protein n=1 Tax=Neisseria sp. TaxID=192066 RepID=UPI0026DB82A7|nr:calcium-binding protein [Neisseria sp.]MDO4248223.1 calcium-binding protein [Neisseria sp.]
MNGTDGNDVIVGGADNDIINGEKGNDIINGGAGNDQLDGGSGVDTFVFTGNWGQDIVTGSDGEDHMYFRDTPSSAVEFKRDGLDLLIIKKGTDEQIRIQGQFSSEVKYDSQVIINWEFADGVVLKPNDVYVQLMNGTDANDEIFGSAGNDSIFGKDGDDIVHGGAGDDYLDGGSGKDILDGGMGDDTFIVSSHDTVLISDEISGKDNILFDGQERLLKDFTIKLPNLDLNDLAFERKDFDDEVVMPDDYSTFDGNVVITSKPNGKISNKLSILFASAFHTTQALTTRIVYQYTNILYDNEVLYTISLNNSNYLDNFNSPFKYYDKQDKWYLAFNGSNTFTVKKRDDLNDDLILKLGAESQLSLKSVLSNINDKSDAIRFIFKNDKIFSLQEVLQKILNDSHTKKDDVIRGFDTNDYIYGDDGNDIIQGGNGNDTLEGGAGNDILIGGYLGLYWHDVTQHSEKSNLFRLKYADQLVGEPTVAVPGLTFTKSENNNDVYIFDLKHGHDVVYDYDISREITGVDTLWFNGIASIDDLVFRKESDYLVISNPTTESSVALYNFFLDKRFSIEIIKIGEQSSHQMTTEFLLSKIGIGTNQNDKLLGISDRDNVLHGYLGDDVLIGDNGNDILNGGTGNDILNGGYGNDIFVFEKNWGHDIIQDNWSNDVSEIDTLRFTDFKSSDDFIVRNVNDDMTITHLGSGDTITVENEFFMYRGESRNINRIEFSDGTIWDINNINIAAVQGTSMDDVIQGVSLVDVIRAGAGNDTVNGTALNDATNEIYGEAGNDTLSGIGLLDGGDGNDVLDGHGLLYGQNGDDTLSGSGELYGGEGNDKLFIKDVQSLTDTPLLAGGSGDDVLDAGDGVRIFTNNKTEQQIAEEKENILTHTLEGGEGNDILYGSFSNEIYVFEAGFGRDDLYERKQGQAYSNVADSYDIIRFGNGIAVDDISYVRRDLDLILQHRNGVDSINVHNYFQEPNNHFKINLVEFADGTKLTSAQIESKITYYGTDAADNLFGYRDSSETIDGGAGSDYIGAGNGNDRLLGGAGNDRLDGGIGNDILDGGAGDDQYYYYAGSGQDIIDQTGGGRDILFTNNVATERVSFRKEGNDLLVVIDNDINQSIRVKGHFFGGEKAIAGVQPNGGNTITAADIAAQIRAQETGGQYDRVIEGTAVADTNLIGSSGKDLILGLVGDDNLFGFAGDDRLEGGDGNDYLDGGDGNDYLFGGLGNDRLAGKAGNDTLDGGAGDDQYYYYAGSGQDIIDQTGGGRDILFTNDVPAERVSFRKDGNDLLVLVDNDLNQSVRVKGHFLGGEKAIAGVQPNGGNTITVAQIATKVGVTTTTPTPPINNPTPTVPSPSTGSYDKTVNGTSAADTNLVGSAGKDLILGLAGADNLFGFAGEDRLEGGDGNDYLDGGDGNDYLFGGLDNDRLAGKAGNDTLDGGAGDDQYYYYIGSGQDTIDQTGGGRDILFTNDAAASRVSFQKDGNDLLVLIDQDVNQSVRVKGHFLGGEKAITGVQPNGGSTITATEIAARIKAQETGGQYDRVTDGTALADTNLVGSAGKDLIYGLAGDDRLWGFAGDDRLDGGDGNDYLSGGNGKGSGSGNDILIGGDGNDTLYGEDGNDYLSGGVGKDSYLYYVDHGIDVIETGGGGDILFFNQIQASQLSYHRSQDDLIILVNGDANQQVRVLKHFLGDNYALGGIQPTGSSTLNVAAIAGKLTTLPESVAATAQATNAMINAMAAFGNQSSGGIAVVNNNPSTNPLLAASSI